jgi:hypothetical protein
VWLEVLLALTILALLLQLLPSAGWKFLGAIDVRNWSSGAWIALNICVVLVLVAVRFGPALAEVHERRCTDTKVDREKAEHRRRRKEERALFERMREARKKQVV